MAFATSPYGLGMTAGQFWDLTPREFQAFVKVKDAHDELAAVRWAVTCSMFANANFRGREHPQAYTADEFLGRAPAQNGKPQQLTPAQQAVYEREKMRLNLALTGMLPEDQVPDWAKATVAASKKAGAVH